MLPGINPLPTAFECKFTESGFVRLSANMEFVGPVLDEDEEGDRITVCSDEELLAMIAYVRTSLSSRMSCECHMTVFTCLLLVLYVW